ncbi:MAG: polyprenyl synthetase family protein [Spirochaetes bacterium]|nr:polyprenyl synthetase family protein [Spirochaetota bacterium]
MHYIQIYAILIFIKKLKGTMMNWIDFYEQKKKIINEKINFYLNELEFDGLLKEAMLYSLNAGGKRIRPFLAILTANILDKNEEIIYPYAVSLEFIHTYSLIHDDLPCMDNDDYRRGMPTSHKRFGEATAVLAGDSLLSDAFTLLFKYGQGNLQRGGQYLAASSGGRGMIYGQILDCNIKEEDRDIKILDNINYYKTGCMLQASTAGAASFLDAGLEKVDILNNYAYNIGLAFQITDDILDITADEKELGKPVGSDVKQNKKTYPVLMSVDEAKKSAAGYIEKAKKCLDNINDSVFKKMLIEFSDFIIKRTN